MSNDKILQPMAGMTLEEMQDAVSALGMPRFVAKQLAQWIYQKRVNDFEQMLNTWLMIWFAVRLPWKPCLPVMQK